MTCKQRRKKCDEEFRLRPNGATSCNRCADRGIHCEMSSTATPQRPPQQQQRSSPYPTPNTFPSGSAKPSSRAVRGPNATPTNYNVEMATATPTSTVPNMSSALPTANTMDATTSPYAPASDQAQAWNNSAHFPTQQFPQQQVQNVAAFPSLQNNAVMNQLAWMSQNAAALNRSAIRYNRPNIWPMTTPNGAIDAASATTGIQNPSANVAAQNNAVDMTALFNLLNSNTALAQVPSTLTPWVQGYSNSMDNIMLDDFVNELMSITGPLAGGESASSAALHASDDTTATATQQSSPFDPKAASHSAHEFSRASSAATSVQRQDSRAAYSSVTTQPNSAHTMEDPSPSTAPPKTGGSKSATPARASNRYRKLLDSDAIESLLSKYSPIYERFWHATLMLLSNKKRQAAVDYLMTVIRSNKACRASVVVVCLAYHELVQRVRKGAQKNNAKQPNQGHAQPPSWTSVATDAMHNGKAVKTPEDGMSHTVLAMFPRYSEDEERPSSRLGTGEESVDEEMPAPRSSTDGQGVDDEEEEDDTEPEEQISTIERRRSDGKPYTPTSKKPSSEQYKTTSFSRRGEFAPRSCLPAVRNLTGKLSTVETNIEEMDDPSRDAFKGQKVEEYTVELWFDIAQAELQRSREELTLDQELCAIINLRWACLCFAGAERARQFTEELGKVMQREGIDLDHAAEEEKKGSFVSVMLLTAVYTDILDTVSDRGKRTHVALRDPSIQTRTPFSKPRRASSLATAAKDEPFFGRISLVSLELLTCFKLISDLSADVWGPISSTATHPMRPSEGEVAERSREIERKVMSLPPWSDPNTSSSLRVRAFALQEIWRQTARLYLLQAVHRRGPLHPELQNILHEVIRLAKMMKIQSFSATAPIFTEAVQGAGANRHGASAAGGATHRTAPANYVGGLRSSDEPNDDVRDANHPDPFINATFGMEANDPAVAHSARDETTEGSTDGPAPFQMWLDVASWEMCTVWFLCSTVALTRQDRQFCIHHLESLGLEKANRDNIQVVRDYWAKQDATGHTLDWFDFVKSTGRSVIFAF